MFRKKGEKKMELLQKIFLFGCFILICWLVLYNKKLNDATDVGQVHSGHIKFFLKYYFYRKYLNNFVFKVNYKKKLLLKKIFRKF